MKSFLFQKLNLQSSVKEELINVTKKIRDNTLEMEQLNENYTNFFLLSPYGNVYNPKKTHVCNPIQKATWQLHESNGTITDDFLDKFKFLKNHWSIVFNSDTGFRHHRHYHDASNGRAVPYQVVVTYGKSILEFVNPLNFNDNVTDPSKDEFATLPEEIESEIIKQCEFDDLEVYIFNSWMYHTLICEDFTRVSVWNPSISNIYEAYKYIDYIESLQ